MSLGFMGRGQNELKVLYWLVTATLAAILLYPLGCVLFQSVLTANGDTGFDNYVTLISQPRFWRAMGNSFTVSGISAAIAALYTHQCHAQKNHSNRCSVTPISAVHHLWLCRDLFLRTSRSYQSNFWTTAFFHLRFLGLTDC